MGVRDVLEEKLVGGWRGAADEPFALHFAEADVVGGEAYFLVEADEFGFGEEIDVLTL